MSKYYLFSGIDKEKGFTKKQASYIKKDLKEDIIITYIASSFDNYDINDNYFNNMIKFFDNIKVKVKSSYLIDNRVTKTNAKKYINKSDVVFIMGGYPSIEMENIKRYNLIDTLRKYNGIIMGVSAGTINMNKIVSFIDKEGKEVTYKGIGLTDFNIAPHLDFTKEGYIKEIYQISKERKTIGLPNDSFIIVKDNKQKMVGEYYIFFNNSYQKGDDK